MNFLNILLGTPQISFGLSTTEWVMIILTVAAPIFAFVVGKAMINKLREIAGDGMEE